MLPPNSCGSVQVAPPSGKTARSSNANTSPLLDKSILTFIELALPSIVLDVTAPVNAEVSVIAVADVVPAESIICRVAFPEPDILLR